MRRGLAFALLFGLLGLVLVPPAAFFVILGIAHAVDPRCGTPGDSGGCEMGSATMAAASAPLGFAAGALFGYLRFRRRGESGGA